MNRLQQMLSEILMCEVDTLSPSTTLADIDGWDSLKHVMIVVGLESQFNVKLTADEIKAAVTLGDIYRVAGEKGADV